MKLTRAFQLIFRFFRIPLGIDNKQWYIVKCLRPVIYIPKAKYSMLFWGLYNVVRYFNHLLHPLNFVSVSISNLIENWIWQR